MIGAVYFCLRAIQSNGLHLTAWVLLHKAAKRNALCKSTHATDKAQINKVPAGWGEVYIGLDSQLCYEAILDVAQLFLFDNCADGDVKTRQYNQQ